MLAKGPLCVGIDPSAELLSRWELPDDPTGLRRFSETVLTALDGVVAVVKPQVAFYERHGSGGFAALETTIALAREMGLVVIADAKRGDIGTTASAYASAWLDPTSALGVDAVTATAYLGLPALRPMIEVARACGTCVIVVARSSNPEGRRLQSAHVDDGASVSDDLLFAIAELNAGSATGAHHGSVGAVVGATTEQERFDYSQLGGPILAPGLGAQGATASDSRRVFAACQPGSVVGSVSRAVLDAGPDQDSLRSAAERWQNTLR